MNNELVDYITKQLTENDPALSPTDIDFMHQAILLASIRLGADEEEIAAALEYDREFVELAGSRLRNAGIWIGDEVAPKAIDRWTAEDSGGTAFLMDALVSKGALTITGNADTDDPLYSLSDSGRALAENLIKKLKP